VKTRRTRAATLVAVALTLAGGPARSALVPDIETWNEPVEPFRIFGPLYYVGTRELAVFALATEEGLILLDGGLPESGPRVEASLERLGFAIADVEILVNSHAHFDHAGGLAALKAASGARLAASEADAELLEAGGRGDFAFGDRFPYPPVDVDRRLQDGETVGLGGVTLTAHLTPGHTRGCTTWTARLEQDGAALDVLFLCSTSVPEPETYRLADNPAYPEIARDYERTFRRLEELPCDLFLGAHASFFGLEEKRRRLLAGGGPVNPFLDPAGCRAYLERSEAAYRALLAEARAAAPPP
jgi:metallo-beta-lactamase class B